MDAIQTLDALMKVQVEIIDAPAPVVSVDTQPTLTTDTAGQPVLVIYEREEY